MITLTRHSVGPSGKGWKKVSAQVNDMGGLSEVCVDFCASRVVPTKLRDFKGQE